MDAVRAQKQDFVTEVRRVSSDLLTVLDRVKAVRRIYDNRDYFNTLADADLTGSAHEGLTKAQVVAAVGSLSAIEAGIVTGNQDDALVQVS